MTGRFFAACYIPDAWIRYPWDAEDLADHSARARAQHAAARLLAPPPPPPPAGDDGRAAAVAGDDGGEAGVLGRAAAAGARARRRTDAQGPGLVLPAA